MRRILLFFLLLPAFSAAFAEALEKGVSAQLARMRSQHVSQVSYDLRVIIPEQIDKPVHGTCTLMFCWKGTGDLPVDYCGESDGAKVDADVNGEQMTLFVQEEHVVLPADKLNQGENSVSLTFKSNDKTLNRHADYLYTLFVPSNARSVFPCFDQPDLKATFLLTLLMPTGWKAFSNAECKVQSAKSGLTHSSPSAPANSALCILHSALSKPLPTYLFSFVAGKFQSKTVTRNGHEMTALYRETDPKKVAQLDQVFDMAARSLAWMEDFTGIKNPFGKYDFVVLPGYQFGGMEHPGSIQYNDRTIFLGPSPTPDEELKRFNLIAHETAHLWFGDYVTMRWFDDVWTKEVFANFLADKMTQPQFPNINHKLNFLRNHYMTSLATDRTGGAHPIQQQLDNLNSAGLLYGNIIYHKAPIMMQKMEEQMGEEKLKSALRKYLNKFGYGNATWDELIAILDSEAPEADMQEFDRVWVKQAAMPEIETSWNKGEITVRQRDPLGRNLVWKQRILLGLFNDKTNKITPLEVNLDAQEVSVPCAERPYAIVPNLDGSGYGRFLLDGQGCEVALYAWKLMPQELYRQAAAMTLYENWCMDRLDTPSLLSELGTWLMQEKNPLVATTLASYILHINSRQSETERSLFDTFLLGYAQEHSLPAIRQQLMRGLSTTAINRTVLEEIEKLWLTGKSSLFSTRDFTQMAYHLALMNPDRWQEILATQRERLNSADDQREFDYISRACNPDAAERKALFESLIEPAGRINEPWARALLALLSDPTREKEANSYLVPGLDCLPYIQQTSDIFFPGYWLSALLGNHQSAEAKTIVKKWIGCHPELPQALKNKLLENADELIK